MYRGYLRVAYRFRPETEPRKVTAELSEGIAQVRFLTLMIGQEFFLLTLAYTELIMKQKINCTNGTLHAYSVTKFLFTSRCYREG